MTSLPQGPGSFSAAMECVYKGGKAWRPNWGMPGYGPYHHRGNFFYKSYDGVVCEGHQDDKDPYKNKIALITQDDLEATDWVCYDTPIIDLLKRFGVIGVNTEDRWGKASCMALATYARLHALFGGTKPTLKVTGLLTHRPK